MGGAQKKNMDRRLPPHARRTLRALWRAVEQSEYDQRQGLPKDHARRVVSDTLGDDGDDESMVVSDEEIDYQLEFLQNCGEIYYVNDWVRITAPDEVTPEYTEGETENRVADESDGG